MSKWDRDRAGDRYFAYDSLDAEEEESLMLYLRVEEDEDGVWRWDVTMSEEDAGFGDAWLAAGSALSKEQAMLSCESAVVQIKIDEAAH